MEKQKINIPQKLTSTLLSTLEERLEIPQKKEKLYIGIPKENGFQENRIALTPDAVKTLVNNGHRVLVESDAGLGSKFPDLQYSEAGAEIAYSAEQVFKANIILKVAPHRPQRDANVKRFTRPTFSATSNHSWGVFFKT